MTALIEKHVGKKVFDQIVEKNNYDDESTQEFVCFLDTYLSEIEAEDAFDEYKSMDDLLSYPIRYGNSYSQSRTEGFSITWSKQYAYKKYEEDDKWLMVDCYTASRKDDEEQALNDLKNYCEVTNRNELYTDYFIKEMKAGAGYEEIPVEIYAERFVTIYNSLLSEGKSELYADKYADLAVQPTLEISCDDFEYIYNEARKMGKSDEFAVAYADQYLNNLLRALISSGDLDTSVDYARAKAKALTNAWDYSKVNKLDKRGQFDEAYANSYLTSLFYSNSNDKKVIEECEKMALKKALASYERLMKNINE